MKEAAIAAMRRGRMQFAHDERYDTSARWGELHSPTRNATIIHTPGGELPATYRIRIFVSKDKC
jgi:hypothetical protein